MNFTVLHNYMNRSHKYFIYLLWPEISSYLVLITNEISLDTRFNMFLIFFSCYPAILQVTLLVDNVKSMFCILNYFNFISFLVAVV